MGSHASPGRAQSTQDLTILLCAQESLLAVLGGGGNHMCCQGLNKGRLQVNQEL